MTNGTITADEKLRGDVEALDNTLFYLTQLEKNLHNDINITKRAANKAMEDINKAEYSKYLQVRFMTSSLDEVPPPPTNLMTSLSGLDCGLFRKL